MCWVLLPVLVFMNTRPSLSEIERLPSVNGTEATVYLGKRRAYRVAGLDRDDMQAYLELIGHDIPQLVRIHDVWTSGNDFVVEMDRLFEPPKDFCDPREVEAFYDTHLIYIRDIKRYNTTCPMLAKVLGAQVAVATAIGETISDAGPHNVMLDKNGQITVVDPI